MLCVTSGSFVQLIRLIAFVFSGSAHLPGCGFAPEMSSRSVGVGQGTTDVL